MSSEVMTHPTWKRLHVALFVSDMVKSMIRLSRLGRSIFPINWPPGRERRNPALALRFRNFGSCGLPRRKGLSKIDSDGLAGRAERMSTPHRVAPFGTLSSEVRDRVETEGEDFGPFLEVGSVKSSFAPPRKDTQNEGLRHSRNRRLPMR